MAIIESSLFDSIRGRLGKQFVFKKYGDKIVISTRPKKYKRTVSPIKALNQQRFKNAVQFASSVLSNKDQRALYSKRLRHRQRLYNFLISEFCRLDPDNKLDNPAR